MAPRGDGWPVEQLRGYDRDQLISFFLKRPVALANRFVVFASKYYELKRLQEREAICPQSSAPLARGCAR